MHEMTVDEALTTIIRMMKASEYSFLVTHGSDGGLHARLMQPFEPEPDLTLWFGASPESRKVKEVASDPRATVAVMHPVHGGYASLMGEAEVVTDPAMRQKYWRAHWTDIYPGGPETAEYALIKFTPKKIELMDFAEEAQPQPYGLKPVGLELTGGTWKIVSDRLSL
jgi:general stress protein 26